MPRRQLNDFRLTTQTPAAPLSVAGVFRGRDFYPLLTTCSANRRRRTRRSVDWPWAAL